MLFCYIVVGGVESVWSGVVSGTQAAVFPAYRPSFHPVPFIHSVSNVDVVRSCTPTSKHSKQGSPLSSSSQPSREDVSSEQDANSCVLVPRRLSLTGSAADSTLLREESRDSGAIFVTPPPSSSPVDPSLAPEFNSTCRNSRSSSTDLPAASLVNVGRKLFGRLNDDGDVEYRRKDRAAGFVSRKSSPGDLRTITDAAEAFVCEQSADGLPDALSMRRSSCYGVLYHRSDEEFVAASKTKKKRKSRRNSQPAQASCSSTKSMAVYGGNPKWVWKS